MRVYVGWDSGEDIAYQVCRSSVQHHASSPVEVHPIKQQEMRDSGLYHRDADPLASTEFTYTRFLTPHLAGFGGWALFCDCDFLWTGDVAALFALADPKYAVMCVQHDHRPPERFKMDGRAQTVYPRKNWSSLMLFNCDHPSTRQLSVEVVNQQSPAYLHRMNWAQDDEIGALPGTWNWLEGWNEMPTDVPPTAIHYTRGGPWFEEWQDVDYADLWLAERDRLRDGRLQDEGE